ncbi:MAG: hypothetical protein IPN67_11400 [Bacteroidales bacterium]|nr:hypothetical protein [Bacteroidales bacterium]MBK8882960.1 hypothetical protein [Bacteroidales bacterium]
MKKVFFIIMLLGLIYQVAKPAVADNSAVVGSWKCAVIDVPYEYSNSTITIAEKEGKLSGVVKFDSGEEVKITTVKFTNSQLVLTLYVEGYSITVDGKVAGSKITGTADTPDGKVNFTATKIVEKKK